jgi:DMSO reductase anchor subunit
MPSTYEQSFVGPDDIPCSGNKNVEWMKSSTTLAFYITLIAFSSVLLYVLGVHDLSVNMSVVNTLHAFLSFYFLHWVKGTPDNLSQGEWNGLTTWEQIDGGVSWTLIRKCLITIPTLLLLITCYATEFSAYYLIVNCSIYAVLVLIPKTPGMHRVRFFGINSTPGIDDPIIDEKVSRPQLRARSSTLLKSSYTIFRTPIDTQKDK